MSRVLEKDLKTIHDANILSADKTAGRRKNGLFLWIWIIVILFRLEKLIFRHRWLPTKGVPRVLSSILLASGIEMRNRIIWPISEKKVPRKELSPALEIRAQPVLEVSD